MNLINKIKHIKQKGKRAFLESLQKKLPFLPIIPKIHNILDPRTFLIFLLYFIECKHNFRYFLPLYSKIPHKKHPRYFLCTQPRGGTRYIKNLYKSALALSQGRSGKPLLDERHIWNWETNLDDFSDLVGLVYNGFEGSKLKQLHPYAIAAAHHPTSRADLVDMKSVRPVFTLRDPIDDCKAWYHHSVAKTPEEWYPLKKIGPEKWDPISRGVELMICHFNYWGEYIKNKKSGEDYLCIKYEELMQNTVAILKSLLQFWGMEIDEKFIIKAAELNTYENTMKYVLEKGISETKAITLRKKTDFDENLLALIKEKLDKELIHDFGYK